MEKARTLQTELEALEEETCCGHHHHHDHDDDCGCGHHHHAHDHEDECGHSHDHDHEDACGHHHHEHEHGEACGHHHHHDGHDADEVFTSWGVETAKKFSRAQLQDALTALDGGACGMVLRAKGIVAGDDGSWIHFDYVPASRVCAPAPQM